MNMDKYTSPTAYAWGTFTAIFGAWSLNDWAIVVGIICTVGTFAVNWYYKHRELNRREKDK
ncbi:phage holin family protein [Xenorhabdus bovienii]|uniref:phage holin family protein n=2 Tax=Xenorhabdus bovienii TaxID=40576 RepID=UPI0023B357C2|nr:phage holin family protein [Xenorhabdus bovienii]MDE9495978.1 phage holin family protein [Xenorhabdus bovienii]MDE9504379.1 phage holin family protein [Xenorhabdus bovienii]